MNNTPIQINTIYMQACIKRMLAAIALIVALICPHAHALDTSPHWDMTAQMSTTHDATEGTLGGYHDRYPTYIVQIDGARVHYSHQGDFSGLGNPVGFSEWFMISRI